MSMGQWLSLPMILAGLLMAAWPQTPGLSKPHPGTHLQPNPERAHVRPVPAPCKLGALLLPNRILMVPSPAAAPALTTSPPS